MVVRVMDSQVGNPAGTRQRDQRDLAKKRGLVKNQMVRGPGVKDLAKQELKHQILV